MSLKEANSTLISVISLIIAISALGYNTWRNEVSEHNRNIRASGFELLKASAKLQLLVDRQFYEDNSQASPIEGWTRSNFIVALSQVMPEQVKANGVRLKATWSENWQSLNISEDANKAISTANKQLETSIIAALAALN
ncbi:MAG: hypothetical protein MI796_18650 [Enterobacterales bacterium]|nr:hypothetical protein [Enterobacterales bacterium]